MNRNIKTKSLVRYPGSKARKAKKLTSMFPNFTGRFIEPFMGSAVVSVYQAEMHPARNIWINDKYTDLYNLWINVRDNSDYIIKRCTEIRAEYPADNFDELGVKLFDDMTELETNGDSLDKAVAFFVKNKVRFSGVGYLTRSCYEKTFNDLNTKKISDIADVVQGFTITNLDYQKVFAAAKPDDFIFLDPPYDIKQSLYGKNGKLHTGFNHREFFEAVVELPCKWLITYNDNETLREWYNQYNIMDEEYLYSMSVGPASAGSKDQTKNELIISNYNINTL